MGAGPQQPIEGSLKTVQIHLAAGQEPLQDVDPALPQLLGDRRFGLDWVPVVVHASRISSDARAARAQGPRPVSWHTRDLPDEGRRPDPSSGLTRTEHERAATFGDVRPRDRRGGVPKTVGRVSPWRAVSTLPTAPRCRRPGRSSPPLLRECLSDSNPDQLLDKRLR